MKLQSIKKISYKIAKGGHRTKGICQVEKWVYEKYNNASSMGCSTLI